MLATLTYERWIRRSVLHEVDVGAQYQSDHAYNENTLRRQPLRGVLGRQAQEGRGREYHADGRTHGRSHDAEYDLYVRDHDPQDQREANHEKCNHVKPEIQRIIYSRTHNIFFFC